jgi:hypothetical protein
VVVGVDLMILFILCLSVIDALWVDRLTFIFGSNLVSRWLTKLGVLEIS